MTYSLAIDGAKMVIKKYEYEGDEVKSGAYYLLDSDFFGCKRSTYAKKRRIYH